MGLANELERNANGFYSRKSGLIMMSTSADNFVSDLSHELTHFIKDYAPDNYAEFQNTVIEYFAQSKDMDLESLIDEYSVRYQGVDSVKNREDILDEIAADSVATFLNNAGFVDMVANKDVSLTQRVIDFFNDIIDALNTLIAYVKNNKASDLLMETKRTHICKPSFLARICTKSFKPP